jgi:hypothetical protein
MASFVAWALRQTGVEDQGATVQLIVLIWTLFPGLQNAADLWRSVQQAIQSKDSMAAIELLVVPSTSRQPTWLQVMMRQN